MDDASLIASPHLTFQVHGSDGVTHSASLTLSSVAAEARSSTALCS